MMPWRLAKTTSVSTPMSGARRARAALLIAGLLFVLGWLSRAPWNPSAAEHGLLRLSWRMRGERIETCRTRTTEELDRLPVHMRTDSVCEARLMAYRLVVRIDEAPPDTVDVLPGGARGDRPLFVLRDIALAPGHHRVRVRFERHGQDTDSAPPLTLDASVLSASGGITLVTLDTHSGRFVLRTSEG